MRSCGVIDICQHRLSVMHTPWPEGGGLKNTYDLVNLEACKFSLLNKLNIFQWMDKIFRVGFHRVHLKFTQRLCNLAEWFMFSPKFTAMLIINQKCLGEKYPWDKGSNDWIRQIWQTVTNICYCWGVSRMQQFWTKVVQIIYSSTKRIGETDKSLPPQCLFYARTVSRSQAYQEFHFNHHLPNLHLSFTFWLSLGIYTEVNGNGWDTRGVIDSESAVIFCKISTALKDDIISSNEMRQNHR